MTDTFWSTLPATITSIVGAGIAFGAWASARRAASKTEETGKKADAIAVKSDEIHSLVDGNATKQEEKMDALEKRIVDLTGQLGQIQERRVEDAKTKAAGKAR